MRFLIGIFFAFVMIALLFGFCAYVSHKMEEWKNMGQELSGVEQMMITSSQFLKMYWYIWVPLLLIVWGSLAQMMLFSSKEEFPEFPENP